MKTWDYELELDTLPEWAEKLYEEAIMKDPDDFYDKCSGFDHVTDHPDANGTMRVTLTFYDRDAWHAGDEPKYMEIMEIQQ